MAQRLTVALSLLLIVAAASACRSLPEVTGDTLDPAAIEAAIRGGIAAQYPDATFDIGISVTQDGVVTLTGTVEDNLRRQKIGEIAADVHDVTRVINNLQVE
ncbi:MAG TPA: BON domain-containing protein [Thermoanaerobaculia bacterium]|nr:BON domain-containing protein [Thermoanaerobaculia bacterium]